MIRKLRYSINIPFVRVRILTTSGSVQRRTGLQASTKSFSTQQMNLCCPRRAADISSTQSRDFAAGDAGGPDYLLRPGSCRLIFRPMGERSRYSRRETGRRVIMTAF